VTELEQLLARSMAAEPFKHVVRSLYDGHAYDPSPPDRVRLDRPIPRIKVRRLLTHVLAAEPDLVVERVVLSARSGCSDFAGVVHVHTTSETRVYEFVWDCRWRAEQEGWTDCFGFPDQLRAADEFDWRCFARWEPVATRNVS
jgi:hypothetical protein